MKRLVLLGALVCAMANATVITSRSITSGIGYAGDSDNATIPTPAAFVISGDGFTLSVNDMWSNFYGMTWFHMPGETSDLSGSMWSDGPLSIQLDGVLYDGYIYTAFTPQVISPQFTFDDNSESVTRPFTFHFSSLLNIAQSPKVSTLLLPYRFNVVGSGTAHAEYRKEYGWDPLDASKFYYRSIRTTYMFENGTFTVEAPPFNPDLPGPEVPEPATTIMMGAGVGLLALKRYRLFGRRQRIRNRDILTSADCR
jgi:hypothetical protein